MTEETTPDGKRWMVPDKDEIKMGFLFGCIEALAESEQVSYLDMLQRLEAADMTQGYILRHYEAIHSQSWEHVIQDLRAMLHRHETGHLQN